MEESEQGIKSNSCHIQPQFRIISHAQQPTLGLAVHWRGSAAQGTVGETWRRLAELLQLHFPFELFRIAPIPGQASRPDCSSYNTTNMSFRGTPRGGRGGGFGGGGRGGFTPRGGSQQSWDSYEDLHLTPYRTRWLRWGFIRTSRYSHWYSAFYIASRFILMKRRGRQIRPRC